MPRVCVFDVNETLLDLHALDPAALEGCVAQGDQLPNVDQNFAEAQRLQLYGTPAFLVNAKLLAGAQPIAV